MLVEFVGGRRVDMAALTHPLHRAHSYLRPAAQPPTHISTPTPALTHNYLHDHTHLQPDPVQQLCRGRVDGGVAAELVDATEARDEVKLAGKKCVHAHLQQVWTRVCGWIHK